ncbi:alpha/beta fold hydrolase [Pseudogemmobacter sonorensis]|uniref:alpha/beta fold hydrolase n=1 Tax=Pseudogemmobacter sonorensis TaxID=2989681 RepID=UPI0036B238C1
MTEPRMIPVVDGVELALWQQGHGPVPLVLLHGYSLGAGTWDRVLPLLPADRFTIYRYEQRGFGHSSKPDSGHSMTIHAHDLKALLDRLDIDRAVLAGHSLGGAISQEFATLWPGRLRAVVSCNALARHRELPGMDAAKRARIAAYGTTEQNRRVFEASVPNYFDPRNRDPETLAFFVEMALRASTAALREQLHDAYAASPLEAARFAALDLPVLALTGATDPVASPEQSIALAEAVPGSEIAIIPRAGHTPMWERPEEWTRIVLEFLARRLGA